MVIHEELSKLRREDISPYLSSVHGQKYVDWHRKAKEEGINWKKLEALALGEGEPFPK
ncbi:MAG: hypothetical protein ACRCY4_02335 [Brevinema sp.]